MHEATILLGDLSKVSPLRKDSLQNQGSRQRLAPTAICLTQYLVLLTYTKAAKTCLKIPIYSSNTSPTSKHPYDEGKANDIKDHGEAGPETPCYSTFTFCWTSSSWQGLWHKHCSINDLQPRRIRKEKHANNDKWLACTFLVSCTSIWLIY